jgi:hypothetical protein
MAEQNLDKINDPGVRENSEGVVIQHKRRSEQMESIANEIRTIIAAPGTSGRRGTKGKTIYNANLHKIDRYMEQLLIIADELKAAGK